MAVIQFMACDVCGKHSDENISDLEQCPAGWSSISIRVQLINRPDGSGRRISGRQDKDLCSIKCLNELVSEAYLGVEIDDEPA